MLRLVGGSDNRPNDPEPDEESTLIRRLSLAIALAIRQTIGGMESGTAIRSSGGVVAPVAGAISLDLDAWENDRRRQNKRGIHADRLRLDGVVLGCHWNSIEDSGPDDFLRFLSHQRRPLEDGEKGRRPWKGATCNKVQTLVSGLLKDVESRRPGRCPINWALGLPRSCTDDSDDGSRPLSWAEFCKLFGWLAKKAPYRFDAYMVMGYTGMRFSEGRLLDAAEVFFDGKPRIILTRRTKKKKKRTIPINADILGVVKRLVGDRKSGRVFQTLAMGGEGFPTVDTLKADCVRAGVDPADVGYHSLRKCFAGRCAISGVPLVVAAKLLGHDDPKLTANLYSHFLDSELADEVDRLGSGGKVVHIEPKSLDSADAFADTASAETFAPMLSTPTQSRSSVPGRSESMVTSQQRDSVADHRPGTAARGGAEADVESHLRDLNPGPMLYESIGSVAPADGEALADLFESIGRVLRSRASSPQRKGGAA